MFVFQSVWFRSVSPNTTLEMTDNLKMLHSFYSDT